MREHLTKKNKLNRRMMKDDNKTNNKNEKRGDYTTTNQTRTYHD